MPVTPQDVDRIRRFNRFYVQRMGLYARDYLKTGHSVTDWRVLYEVDSPDRPTAREIATRLELDEGQVSRILARFIDKGWIARRPARSDRRRKILELTQAGQVGQAAAAARIRADLDARLDGLPLPEITAAMALLERRLTPIRPGDIDIRPIAPGDMGWILERHGAFCVEKGFDTGFEALVARIMADAQGADPARNRGFVAHHGADRLGSIYCVEGDRPDLAQLRLFWVEPMARGGGLGRRLVDTCLDFARKSGFTGITLFTLSSQEAARRIYTRSGFERTETGPMTAFGAQVAGETWTRPL